MARILQLSALATAGALALSSAVAAAPMLRLTNNPSVVSEKVSLEGLDMQSRAGAKVALLRIHRAASDICGPEPSLKSPDVMKREHRDCMQKAVGDAVAAVNAPMLTALNDGAGPAASVLATAQR